MFAEWCNLVGKRALKGGARLGALHI